VIFPKRSLRDRRQQVDYRGCEWGKRVLLHNTYSYSLITAYVQPPSNSNAL
jgi:hypothetical protein